MEILLINFNQTCPIQFHTTIQYRRFHRLDAILFLMSKIIKYIIAAMQSNINILHSKNTPWTVNQQLIKTLQNIDLYKQPQPYRQCTSTKHSNRYCVWYIGIWTLCFFIVSSEWPNIEVVISGRNRRVVLALIIIYTLQCNSLLENW